MNIVIVILIVTLAISLLLNMKLVDMLHKEGANGERLEEENAQLRAQLGVSQKEINDILEGWE